MTPTSRELKHQLGNVEMALNGALYVINGLLNGDPSVRNMAEGMIEIASKEGRI